MTRGWLGVEPQDVTARPRALARGRHADGVVIRGVQRGGPADKAGVKPGDVLLSVEGKPVHQAQSVLNTVSALPPGSNAKLALKRQGQDLELTVAVGKRPKPQVRAE